MSGDYIIHTRSWNPNEIEQENRYRINVALWPDQMVEGYTDSGLPFCRICKQRLILIEDGKYLFCKICGERQEIKLVQEKKKAAITSKGGSAKGTNNTVLTSQPNMRRNRKPISKEEQQERKYFGDLFNEQEF